MRSFSFNQEGKVVAHKMAEDQRANLEIGIWCCLAAANRFGHSFMPLCALLSLDGAIIPVKLFAWPEVINGIECGYKWTSGPFAKCTPGPS